jgi:hypothetical protein
VAVGVFDNEVSDQKFAWENHSQLTLHNYTIAAKNNKYCDFI